MVLVPLSTPYEVTEPSVGPVHCTFPVVSCNLFAYFVLETLGAFQIKPHRALTTSEPLANAEPFMNLAYG